MGETALKRRIMLAVGAMPDVIVLVNAQTFRIDVRDDGSKRASRGGLGEGSADLIVVLGPLGRFVALETKDENRHVHKEHEERQRAWGRAIRAMGGFYAFVESVPEALDALDRARRGATS